MDCSLPGFSIHGILQARTLERVAISFSNAGKWKVKVKSLSRVWLLATPWTAAYQAPPSMGFSRQQYWSGVPLPSQFMWKTSKTSNQEVCTTYVGHRHPSIFPWERRHWGLPGWLLEAPAKLVSLVGLRSRRKLSQRLRERMTWGDQASVSKAHSFIFNRGFYTTSCT